MEEFLKFVEGMSKVMEKITLARITMLFVFVVTCVSSALLWENRDIALARIMETPTIGYGLGVGLIVFILGFIFMNLMNKVEESQKHYIASLEERNDELAQGMGLHAKKYQKLVTLVTAKNQHRRAYDEIDLENLMGEEEEK